MDLNNFLIDYYYYYLILLFLVFLFLLLRNKQTIIKEFSRIKNLTWLILIIILLISFSLNFFHFKGVFVFNDELFHIGVAQSMAHENNFCACLEKISGECTHCVTTHWPAGNSFILSFLSITFGNAINNYFIVSNIFGVFNILLIFLLSYLIFQNRIISLISAFIMSFIPAHIVLSGSFASETYALTFLSLFLLFFFLFLKNKTFSLLLLSVVTFLFLIQFRFEYFVFIFLFVLKLPRLFRDYKQKKILLVIFFFVLLTIPLLLHLSLNGANRNLHSAITEFDSTEWISSPSELFKNLSNTFLLNIKYFLFNFEYPIFIFLLAILGMYNIYHKNKRLFFFFLLWIIFFILIYSMNNNIYSKGTDYRHLVELSIPVITLSAFVLKEYFFTNTNKTTKIISTIIIIGVMVIFLLYGDLTGKRDWLTTRHQYVHFSEALHRDYSENCTLISDRPDLTISLHYLDSTKNALSEEMSIAKNITICEISFIEGKFSKRE